MEQLQHISQSKDSSISQSLLSLEGRGHHVTHLGLMESTLWCTTTRRRSERVNGWSGKSLNERDWGLTDDLSLCLGFGHRKSLFVCLFVCRFASIEELEELEGAAAKTAGGDGRGRTGTVVILSCSDRGPVNRRRTAGSGQEQG